MMLSMAKVPVYLTRARMVARGQTIDTTLVQEVDCTYRETVQSAAFYRALRLDARQKIAEGHPKSAWYLQIEDGIQRMHPFHLGVAIILGCILGTLSGGFDSELQEQMNGFAREIYGYVPMVQKWRPLGASYMMVAVMMAWIGTDDPALKGTLQAVYTDLHNDFPLEPSSETDLDTLERSRQRLLTLGL